MSKPPLKYSPNTPEKPKQKAPFFERMVKRTRSYVATDFNVASIVKVRDNDGNIMTLKDSGKPIDAKDKNGNLLIDVQNPTYSLIGKSFLNDDKTINVKKAINPFRAADAAIKAIKYGVARAVDKEVVTMKPPPSSIGAMIVKGLVQVAVLPLELPIKALKNLTDVGINGVANTIEKWQDSKEQADLAKKDGPSPTKTIQAPQQETSQSQSVEKQKETAPTTPEVKTAVQAPQQETNQSQSVEKQKETAPTTPEVKTAVQVQNSKTISAAELGQSEAVQRIRDALTRNTPPASPRPPSTPRPAHLAHKTGQNTGQGR